MTFTPPMCPLDALNRPRPNVPQSGIGSLGIRYVLKTVRLPDPPIQDMLRSPRQYMPGMTIMHISSLSGGTDPAVFAAGTAMPPDVRHCRRSAALPNVSVPKPKSASDTNSGFE